MVLAAVNAKYIHSSAAARALSAYARAQDAPDFTVREFTINQSAAYIAAALFNMAPRAMFFSCYIWNISLIRRVARILRKTLPGVSIIFGGPEVSYEYEPLFAEADIIVIGEGERTFTRLLRHFANGEVALADIPGIAFMDGDAVRFTGYAAPLSMSDLPFPYTDADMPALAHQIVYYETSRGCPFDCQYCLSSATAGVRYRPLDMVLAELAFFLRHGVRQVKLIDRTFNCDAARALAICRFLTENDNGVTNFHFEVAAELLDAPLVDLFRTARAGLFQLEIGVQSTNPSTLSAIRRRGDFTRLSAAVRAIKEAGRTHLHLDLIACLPEEDYAAFGRSFNDVYALAPHKLQLGFLKLLKGSGLRRDAARYGIVAEDDAPYEALSTAVLPHADVLRLRGVENVLELFHNTGHFTRTLECLVPLFETPFSFHEALAAFWTENGFEGFAHSRVQMYSRLRAFCAEKCPDALPLISDLLVYDMLSVDKAVLSGWMAACDADAAAARRFYDNAAAVSAVAPHLAQYPSSRLHRMCCLTRFAYNPHSGAETETETYILFDYHAPGGVQAHDVTAWLAVNEQA